MAPNLELIGGWGVCRRRITVWAVVTGLILMVPLVAMQFSAEVNWTLFDFLLMGALLFGTGLTYELVSSKRSALAYRVAVGIACAAGLLLVWVNGAVGIIGDEDEANAMYASVLVVGLLGALIARFEPHGMARALVAMAVAQTLVPLVAMTWVPASDFAPGVVQVLVLNGVFVAMWLASAWLFREASTGTVPRGAA